MRARGFTLFEVMAAVLVLGIVYTVLADAAMDGLRSEGINRRRGEASLLADQRLAEIEATLAQAGTLDAQRQEEDLPPFRIFTEVTSLDVLDLLPPPAAAERDALPSAQGEPPEPTPILALDASGQGRLKQVAVTVEWDEAGVPYQVSRRMIGFVTAGLEEFFPDEGGVLPDGEEIPDEEDVPEGLQDLLDRFGGSAP